MHDNKCSDCIWTDIKDVASFCVDNRAFNKGCDLFLPKNKFTNPSSKSAEEECKRCKKKKDVGKKCWWCKE
jgi:hypothetical protein